jgi:hypothetical protein
MLFVVNEYKANLMHVKASPTNNMKNLFIALIFIVYLFHPTWWQRLALKMLPAIL